MNNASWKGKSWKETVSYKSKFNYKNSNLTLKDEKTIKSNQEKKQEER